MRLVLIGDNSITIRKVSNDELYKLIDNEEFIELHDILVHSVFEVEIRNINNPSDLQFDGTDEYLKLERNTDNTMYKIMED